MAKNDQWIEAINLIKSVANQTEMTEELKWGIPVYTLNGNNVIGIAGFKSYIGIWFYQGVFLKDKYGLLVNANEEKTKALRQMRFQSLEDIDTLILKEYINEAIENEKIGLKYTPVKKKTIIPTFFEEAMRDDISLKDAFQRLTPGKQREYCEYIESAKQEKTKLSRLEKITPMILAGKGLNDKYKK